MRKPEEIIKDKKTRELILKKLLETRRSDVNSGYLEIGNLLEMEKFKKVVNIRNSYERIFEFNLNYLEEEGLIERKDNVDWSVNLS